MGLHYGTERLYHRETGSHGTEVRKDASADNKWMIVQCAALPKVWILEISIKSFRISGSVSGSRLKAVLGIRFRLQTHYPAGYPPDNRKVIISAAPLCCDWKARVASSQSFTLRQQATIEITRRAHSISACSCHICMGVVLHAHPVCDESHIQHNVNWEYATLTARLG